MAAAAVAGAVALIVAVVTFVARNESRPRVAPTVTAPTVTASASTASASTASATPSAPSTTAGSSTTAVATPTPTPAAALTFDVPWIDRPALPPVPASPPPTPPLPKDAPPCRADQLAVTAMGSQMTEDDGTDLNFRNTSARPCLLSGWPNVVATGPGLADTPLATSPSYGSWSSGSWNMGRGESTIVWVRSPRACLDNASDAERRRPHFTNLVIAAPGGGSVTVTGISLHARCSSVLPYWRPPPPEQPPPSPFAGLTAAITMPAIARAGETFSYVLGLTNATTHDVTIDHCPTYLESSAAPGEMLFKSLYLLNCDTSHQIRPGETIRYEIRATLPADTPSGPLDVWLEILEADQLGGKASVRVVGNDRPCQGEQLVAVAAAPAVAFERAGLYDAKDAGTALEVVVTNTSATACTLQGSPTVEIRGVVVGGVVVGGSGGGGGGGGGLGVPFADSGFRFPRLPVPQVTLDPGGTAVTVLAWHTQWCKADPNPVTVRLTLPGAGGTVSVVPAHGWTPPPCSGFSFGTVSSDPFQPGR